MLDSRFTDADADETPAALLDPENDDDGGAAAGATATAAGQTIADALLGISLQAHGPWNARQGAERDALHILLTQQYPARKALVFSQFTDTVRYLEAELRRRCVRQLAGVTGDSPDP